LAVPDSTASSAANFGHEILIFFVKVVCISHEALISLGGEIDFTIFCEMTGLSTTMTDDIGAESTHLRTIIFTMSDFATCY
jgi:hypothetical protein